MPPPSIFNQPPLTEIYTLSLHDALPISGMRTARLLRTDVLGIGRGRRREKPQGQIQNSHGDEGSAPHAMAGGLQDRKSTRLNSSHRCISYAVFCLKKKKEESELG